MRFSRITTTPRLFFCKSQNMSALFPAWLTNTHMRRVRMHRAILGAATRPMEDVPTDTTLRSCALIAQTIQTKTVLGDTTFSIAFSTPELEQVLKDPRISEELTTLGFRVYCDRRSDENASSGPQVILVVSLNMDGDLPIGTL